jgi:hypothetical protein
VVPVVVAITIMITMMAVVLVMPARRAVEFSIDQFKLRIHDNIPS